MSFIYTTPRYKAKKCRYCEAGLHDDDVKAGYCKGKYECIVKHKQVKISKMSSFETLKVKENRENRNTLMHAPIVSRIA